MVEATKIVEEARSWVGTPFHAGARIKGIGADCAGLVVGIAEHFGMVVPGLIAYGMSGRHFPRGDKLLERLRDICGNESFDMKPGTIGIFTIHPRRRLPQHLAILTESTMIHADADVGAVVEHHVSILWRERFICNFHFPPVRQNSKVV